MQDSTLASDAAVANVSGTLLEMHEVIEKAILMHDSAYTKKNELTFMLVLAIAETFGGQAFYLPKGAIAKRWLRNHRLYEDWKGGMTHKELIKKYKLSSTVIYSVLNKMRPLQK